MSVETTLPESIVSLLETLIENHGYKAIANKLADIETANQFQASFNLQAKLSEATNDELESRLAKAFAKG